MEGLHAGLNLRNDKWVVNCSYNPHENTVSARIDKQSQSFSLFSDYEKLTLLEDFNVEIVNDMKSFCENYSLKKSN